MRDFSKRIRKAFKRLCDPFKRTLNGYKRIFPLNGKALVSVFAFQVTNSKINTFETITLHVLQIPLYINTCYV